MGREQVIIYGEISRNDLTYSYFYTFPFDTPSGMCHDDCLTIAKFIASNVH